jgi:lipopolysaccharide export system protein LptA
MQLINRHPAIQTGPWLFAGLLLMGLLSLSLPLMALESDRQQPLEVNANSTDGTLGDGVTTLRGSVDIRQGTLHITADEAAVNKVDGRVNSVTFRGKPAFLEQEIEEQGLVQAKANTIDYQVASGLVTLTGNADVKHPQYQISGESLTYDLNVQHFEGSGDENGNGRIHIRLDPEVINNSTLKKDKKDNQNGDEAEAPKTPAADPDNSEKENN